MNLIKLTLFKLITAWSDRFILHYSYKFLKTRRLGMEKMTHSLVSAIDRHIFCYRNSGCWHINLALCCLWTTKLADGHLVWPFTNKAVWDYKRFIFIRCRTEYELKDQAAKGDEATRKRFHAFVLFLGELYLNLEVRRHFLKYFQEQWGLGKEFVFTLYFHSSKSGMGEKENNVSVPTRGGVWTLKGTFVFLFVGEVLGSGGKVFMYLCKAMVFGACLSFWIVDTNAFLNSCIRNIST